MSDGELEAAIIESQHKIEDLYNLIRIYRAMLKMNEEGRLMAELELYKLSLTKQYTRKFNPDAWEKQVARLKKGG